MARRDEIRSVLVIGSGPIVIGQAAEFDYSGTQALRVLREEGLRVVLINSNPATIMTDPELADATYVEPITPKVVENIIARERPDALLPTLGGQTALNTAIALDRSGVLEEYSVELIGARVEAIEAGEDREAFKAVVERCGAQTAKSKIVRTMAEALATARDLGYPVVVRPSFTMGGLGSGVAYNPEDLNRIVGAGLQYSPTTEVLLEESILGWKEYELELMRDKADNVVVVCSIENVDPVGVHTGDSITVAPAMTLTDREYQKLRDIAIAVIREVGVDTGGCNIQFAVEPDTGRIVVIEMNPRVSRSSALASKATGFPIAKIATKLSLGYTLDEIANDITKKTPASFEPALDYVVVKMPRFAFEKFPAADAVLTTTMKSVGEVMAIGRSFTEALQKAVRSLEEQGNMQQDAKSFDFSKIRAGEREKLAAAVKAPTAHRIFAVQRALAAGISVAKLHQLTGIDPWFLDQLQIINEVAFRTKDSKVFSKKQLREAKRHGFSDAQIARLTKSTEAVVRGIRHALGIRPVFKTVDTCAAEFQAQTPYYYSSYDLEDEVGGHQKKSVIILGSGPNRIGQGVEFDYSCVHASMALQEYDYETVIINCNPETVSTDYDVSSRLYFEPLTLEDVLEVIAAEERSGGVFGVFVQLGGQTPLKLAQGLVDAGITVLGTSPEAIDLAEERGAFSRVLEKADLTAPKNGTAVFFNEAKDVAAKIGYPVLVRPSYVLGGRGMEIVYDDRQLEDYIKNSTEVTVEHPMLIDRFLEDAIEIDVDALYDGQELYLGGVMEHIEEAGVHSGDSACVLPPVTLTRDVLQEVRRATEAIARAVGVLGLINIQFALASDVLYVLEANPRASRTVPFVSKVTGVQLAKAAALIGVGKTITQLRHDGILKAADATYAYEGGPVAVKEAVLPFSRFRTPQGLVVDSLLGPEMRSTGEVMGIDKYFDTAFAKSQAAANSQLPTGGKVFLSVANRDKRAIVMVAKRLVDFGFEILSTGGTADVLHRNGIGATLVSKVGDPGIAGKTVVDLINEGEVAMVFNTPSGGRARGDGYEIRAAGTSVGIPVITTLAEIVVALQAIEAMRKYSWDVMSLQEYASFTREAPESLPQRHSEATRPKSSGHDPGPVIARGKETTFFSVSSSPPPRMGQGRLQSMRHLIQNDSGAGKIDKV